MPPASVDDYIAGFPPDIAALLERIRATIRKAAPMAEEKVKYGMAGYFIGKQPLIYLAGWKRHAGLYPVHPQAPDLELQVAPLRAAKDALQLRYDQPLPLDAVTGIVAARVAQLLGHR